MKGKNNLRLCMPSIFGFSSDEQSCSSDEVSLSLNSLAMKPCLNPPANRQVEIVLLNNHESVKIPLEGKDVTVEEACTIVAATIGITPLYRHMFSLQTCDRKEWLPLHVVLQTLTTNVFVYKIRFKAGSLARLKEQDPRAFEYYYFQVRHDLLSINVRNLNYEKEEANVLGLVVTDMVRAVLEDDISVSDIESRFKSFVPKVVLKNHFFNNHLKTIIMEKLQETVQAFRRDVMFVKEEYLMHFELHAKGYLVEEFQAQTIDGGLRSAVNILVDPYHPEMPGLQVSCSGKDQVTHLCTIDDLYFISIRNDGTMELFRKNGVPVNYCFSSVQQMNSFVSLLDGYYRLSVKWTFNLCKDLYTPSLSRLIRIKCHGPVGGQFSYSKLQEKRENKPGCYILRECESCHNTLYLDVCQSNAAKPKTYRIKIYQNGNCTFGFDEKTYPSLLQLLATYRGNQHPTLQLLECIPPVEYDKSQALICAHDAWASQLGAVTNPEGLLLSAAPQCINLPTLQIFPGSRREGRSGTIFHYRGMWKYTKRLRVKVTVKELKPDLRDQHLGDFLELAGRWSCLQANGLVKLYGVTLAGRISMVTEYLELGPLDEYLAANPDVEVVDLIEAASSLAMALYQMEEAGMTHGNIRCRKAMVSARSSNKFTVKLCDPGLHTYGNDDIPWIPPECYQNLSGSKLLVTADVWAFGTTLWEIFSRGKKPFGYDSAYFLSGRRLPLPHNCPPDIFLVMRECWETDVFKRKKPHAIMRDVYHILYQVFNGRRGGHHYESAYSAEDNRSLNESGGGSVRSDTTDETMVTTDPLVDDLIPINDSEGDMSDMSIDSGGKIIIFPQAPYSMLQPEISTNMPLNLRPTFEHFREEAIYQLGRNCNVYLQGSVGKGHYGEVFRGVLERTDHVPQQVAVKRLTRDALSTSVEDFEREIAIMQKLQHPNIVTIIGEIPGELSLVMEYVTRGCLHGYLAMNKHKLRPVELLKFAEDVAKGMEYLGKKKIVHRDLAARNILVASENLVKISDFGLAQFVDTANGDYYMLQTCRDIPIKWHAPESLSQNGFSPRSDVWSYGVTLFEMFTFGEDPHLEGRPDEESIKAQYDSLARNCRLPCPEIEGGREVYRDLMTRCWQFESQNRPTFTEIIRIIAKLRNESIHFNEDNSTVTK